MWQNTGSEKSSRNLCAGPGCSRRAGSGDNDRTVPATAELCDGCRDELLHGLRVLPDLHKACGHALGGTIVSPSRLRERVAGTSEPSLPLNVGASDARTSVLHVLGSWTGMVVEQRKIAAPRRTVADMAAFLAKHSDWLVSHSAATELVSEIAQLVRKTRAVLHSDPTRRLHVGSCVEKSCAGRLVALLHPEEKHTPLEITCQDDSAHSWPGHQWLKLSRRLGTPGANDSGGTRPRWLSVETVSRLWNTSHGTVYRLASERKWRRVKRAGRTYYHGSDVELTFEHRS